MVNVGLLPLSPVPLAPGLLEEPQVVADDLSQEQLPLIAGETGHDDDESL